MMKRFMDCRFALASPPSARNFFHVSSKPHGEIYNHTLDGHKTSLALEMIRYTNHRITMDDKPIDEERSSIFVQ
jgi:hypothetical protein